MCQPLLITQTLVVVVVATVTDTIVTAIGVTPRTSSSKRLLS